MTDDTDITDDADDEQPAEELPGGVPDADVDDRAEVDRQDDGVEDREAGGEGDREADEDADVRAYLLKAALVMLAVLGVVATIQFYLSTQTAIRRFASDEFRPVFVAAFNLVVLLAVGVGIAQVVRRMG